MILPINSNTSEKIIYSFTGEVRIKSLWNDFLSLFIPKENLLKSFLVGRN